MRTGRFIEALLADARTLNEYAFALGALSHYVGDSVGHADAVNPSTAIQFPKLEKQYGPSVNYGEAPHPHVRTEFAFDINQLSHHRLAPAAYLRFIGIEVSRSLLERAFYETYGLPLRSVLGEELPAIRSYRSSVRSFLPRIAYAENVLHRHSFPEDTPNEEFRLYEENLARTDYAKAWQSSRRQAGFTTHLLAGLIFITPKLGILSDLAIRGPSQEAEESYIRSMNRAVRAYGGLLGSLGEEGKAKLTLADRDLDTGDKVKPGLYPLTDRTYARLLERITANPAAPVRPDLRRDILDYYCADPNAAISTKKDQRAWRRVVEQLGVLERMPARS